MIDWTHIDTVMLDMDGTLLDLNFDNQFWLKHVPTCYADKNGISFDDACKIIYPQMNSVRGTLDWYCLHYWSRQLGLNIVEMKLDLAHLIRPRPGVFEFLRFLRDNGKTTWLTTNAHQDSIDIKLGRVDLASYLDQVVSSHALEAPKESPLFWQRLNRYGVFDPARSLFIDDSPAILRVAQHFGIRYLLSIKQPDITVTATQHEDFIALDHFDQITTGNNGSAA